MKSEERDEIIINGIVAKRDNQPYLQIMTAKFGIVAQLSMNDARTIAADIVQMCARTEADAMIHKFFNKQGYPEGAANALMIAFRDFRHELDMEAVERTFSDPETGEQP